MPVDLGSNVHTLFHFDHAGLSVGHPVNCHETFKAHTHHAIRRTRRARNDGGPSRGHAREKQSRRDRVTDLNLDCPVIDADADRLGREIVKPPQHENAPIRRN
jgi:hypothetical protein